MPMNIRRDGSIVGLKNGYGTLEHYSNVIPDYRILGPIMLLLLIFSWGATAISIRTEAKKSLRGALIRTTSGVILVLCLSLYWGMRH
jgi:hypothetical protein